MKNRSILGMQLFNANGDIDPGSAGFQYVIDTLTFIRSRVIEQVFYEIPVSDFMPVDVGEGAWSEEIVQNLEFYSGGGFFDGDVDTMSGNGRIAEMDTAIAPIRMPTRTWAKSAKWTVLEIMKAASASNWDVVEGKLKSLKKNWDLGIQEVAFLGHPTLTSLTGLLNDPEVNINTSLITGNVNAMTDANFQIFVGALLNAYYTNSNSTRMPDTFIMPTDDYLGMATAASATYPNISKLEYLMNSLKRMTANEGFQILPLTYAQAAINAPFGINEDRYVLYRSNPDTLSMAIPVDFTMLNADTSNQLMWQQPAYGQYSGCLINRKREVLYIDQQ